MEESVAEDVVQRLRDRRIFAHINRRAGVYNVGVRVVIPDGREAIWDNDGAAGLEAMVLRDGVLVGFVPQLPDSDDLDAGQIADIIAATDYDAPPPPAPSHPTRDVTAPASDQTPPSATAAPVTEQPRARGLGRWRRRG